MERSEGKAKLFFMRGNAYDPFAIKSKLRKPMTALAYPDRGRSGYKVVFPLPLHHISFLHDLELVNYIHVFLIVFLVCNSLYKCSTHSTQPNFHQLNTNVILITILVEAERNNKFNSPSRNSKQIPLDRNGLLKG